MCAWLYAFQCLIATVVWHSNEFKYYIEISATIKMRNKNTEKWDIRYICDKVTDVAKNIVMLPTCIIEGNAKFHLEISKIKQVIFFHPRSTDSCMLSQVKIT